VSSRTLSRKATRLNTQWIIKVKNEATGEWLPDVIADTREGVIDLFAAWARKQHEGVCNLSILIARYECD